MSGVIRIEKVASKKKLMEFIKLPWSAKLYEDDGAWVPPVVADQVHFFDPEHGYFFEHGEAQLFIAYRDGKPAGRISAHTYSRYEERYGKDTGFFGFYECIDDLGVSRALFDAAGEWLRGKGKKKMNGPQSFTVYDQVGFDVINNSRMPVIGMFHFAEWYGKHAEAYGLEKKSDWFCFLVKTQWFDWAPFLNLCRELEKNSGVKYVTTRRREIPKRAGMIKNIFNVSWEGNEGHIPFTDRQFDMLFKELKMAIIPDLAIFAEKDGRTVGFILSIPDANPGIAALNGHLYPWRIVRLLWRLKKTKTLRTILMGVLPEYRGQNIDQVLILRTIEIAMKHGYIQSDCSLIVESNKKMIGALKYLNADRYKGYRVYEMEI